MRLIVVLLCICLLLTGTIHAQPNAPVDDFPTLTTLANTEIPAADPVLLAQRLRGVDDVTAKSRIPPELDTVEPFMVINSSQARSFTVDARLQVIGEHIYLWVEDGVNLAPDDLQSVADGFDERVYNQVRELWGSEPNPGIDGDPRVHVLFVRGLGAGTGAYYARRHRFPQSVNPTSNEREMFFVNLDAYSVINANTLESTLAHEFQHMIRDNIDVNQDTWLNEGLSTFTEFYLGHQSNLTWLSLSFLSQPGTQLTTFGGAGTSRAQNYGAGFLFMTYLYEQYGVEALQALSDQTVNGLAAVNATLNAVGGPSADTFFAEWVVANWVQDAELGYGYAGLPNLMRSPMIDTISRTRYINTSQVSQYATNYYSVEPPANTRTLTIDFSQQAIIGLAPAEPFSGETVMYSNRADVSHSTLTHAFDLTDVDSATLTYQAWWEIEEGWDYAYLTASDDDGQTWDIIAAPGTTTSNPHGNAYGPGYSGSSDGWVEQSVSLDDYAGGEVLISFEMITDDAVTEAGLLLDDITIPEINYFTDFEADDGGWQAAGWIRTDNRLPQRAWIQLIQITPAGVVLDRWQATTPELTISVTLDASATETAIAISPFAPLTTVPATYALEVALD